MYKRILLLSLLLTTASVLSVAHGTALGQTPPKRLSSTPTAFQTFYRNFRNAVTRRDKLAVASMTQFPFEYGWDAGDEGTYTRRQFLAKFDDIVGRNKGIFRRANPRFYVNGNSFDLTDESDASHFGFTKTRTGYKFTSMIVEP